MDINLTLLGEMITFAVLVWVTMKYIWPPMTRAMQERQQKIAAGLEAAERGQHSLEIAQKNIAEQLRAAKQQADAILDQANNQAVTILEDTRAKAQKENHRIVELAKKDIEQEVNKIKRDVQKQTAELVVVALEKFLHKEIDAATHAKLIDQFIEQLHVE